MWKRLYKKLEIGPTVGKPVPLPQDEDLDQFEVRHGFRLPRSYREFVKLFGPGEIGRYFRINSPAHGKKRSMSDFDRALKFYAGIRDVFSQSYGDTEFIERMIPFSDTIGGDVIVWEPLQIESKKDREYGIYVLPRDDDKIIFLVDSFRSYIEKVCLGKLFAKKLRISEWSVSHTFTPFGKKLATSRAR